MDTELEIIINYLNEKRGFDFSGYRASMVERRIKKRLSATKTKDPNEYLHYLKNHPDELDKLIDALTINVSRFFRDTLTFEYIADRILPVIVYEKKNTLDHSLRIWSAGCSMGEEPYSIAILINELFEREKQNLDVNIFATDIDKGILIKAREAVYPFESIKSIKYRLLKRYFTPVKARGSERGAGSAGESFRLIQDIKDLVSFSHFDMLDRRSYAPPESVFGSFDMVLCRNLLIYFNIGHQDIIFDKLYRSLSNNGYLILGDAEIPAFKYQRSLKKVNEYCHIYQKR